MKEEQGVLRDVIGTVKSEEESNRCSDESVP
jgi:hypothetical protein